MFFRRDIDVDFAERTFRYVRGFQGRRAYLEPLLVSTESLIYPLVLRDGQSCRRTTRRLEWNGRGEVVQSLTGSID